VIYVWILLDYIFIEIAEELGGGYEAALIVI
jgi:hypothetical protein